MNWIGSQYLRYAALGFSVMPVRVGTKKPALDTWKPLQTQIVPDAVLLDWAAQGPRCGIAIICGLLSDVIVIDDDRAGKPSNPQADEFIHNLSTLSTAVARTKKGRHFYFRLPRVLGSRVAISNVKLFGGAVETRGEGGYVVAPPSPHPDGGFYVWEREPEQGILELPQWAYDVISRSEAAYKEVKPWERGIGGVPEGERDSTAASVLGRWLSLHSEQVWATEGWPMFVAWNESNTPPLTMVDLQKVWNSITARERGKQKQTVFPTVDRAPLKMISAYELGQKRLDPPDFAVRDLIVDGTTQLFGKPKTGKSYLTLQSVLAVATGKPLFPSTASMWAYANHPGGFETHKGDVLYLALEDSELRLQERIRQLWGSGEMPSNVTLATRWWTCADGGLIAIENWIKSVEHPRLIGIDTVAAFFGSVQSKGSAFRAEYLTFQPVWELSQQYKVPILMPDHASKGKGKGGSSDPFDTGAGTLGSQACVDTVIVMVRDDKEPRARLHIKSRDFEDHRFDIEHSRHDPVWRIALPKPPEDDPKLRKNEPKAPRKVGLA